MGISKVDYQVLLAREAARQYNGSSGPTETREKDLHQKILGECNRRGFPISHCRMDRPTTCGIGTPDFAIALPMGRTLWVECKVGSRKLTSAQLAWMARLRHHGHQAHVVRSFASFLQLLNNQPAVSSQ